LFELLLQLALEIFEQLVFEVAVTLGWESLKHAFRPERVAGALFAFGMALVRFLYLSA
jgi:hypothetical protein